MIRTGWQRTWVRIVTTMLTLCVMIMIFAFSTQNADRSDHTSGIISKVIISIVYRDYAMKAPEEQKEIYDSVQHTVRKCAHFLEYTLLGFLLRLCLESWFGYRIQKKYMLLLLSILCGILYAGTDEWHQRMIDGRSGQWNDVLLDGCGVLFGAVVGNRLINSAKERRKALVQNNGNEHCTG